MAEIVATIGVPHTPAFPTIVAREGAQSETGQLFGQIRAVLDDARADTLVLFDSDHFNTFFFDNLPALSIPVADRAQGTNDGTPGMAGRDVELTPDLGASLLSGLTEQGLFPSRNAALTLDHSVMVPLHFLDPDARFAVQPVYVNGLAAPLPLAAACYQLGVSVRSIVESWDSNRRVAIAASGSFSLEVGGPRVGDDVIFGVPDPEWAAHVTERLRAGQVSELIAEATGPRMWQAGNVGGELLNWIAALGVVGDRPPSVLEHQAAFGHSYAAWTGE